MAEVSYPSPTHNARNVTDAEYEKVTARFSDDGVYGDPTQGDVIVPGTGLQVLVKAGAVASIRGHAWESGTTDIPLAISSNGSGAARYDMVVLRLDRSTWDVNVVVLEGTAGSGYPFPTQDTGDTGVFDISLGIVTVMPGAGSVSVNATTQFVGSRIRAANSNSVPFHNSLGEVHYRPDAGSWQGWDGTAWRTLYSDTGIVNLGAGFDSWENVYANVGRRVGEQVWLRLWVRRIGSNMTGGGEGSKIGLVPAALRSSYNNQFPGRFSNGSTVDVEVRNDGEIWVNNIHQNVYTGNTLHLTCNYLRV